MKQKIKLIGLSLVFIYGRLCFAEAEPLEADLAQQKATVGYYLNNNNNIAPLSYTTINAGATWSLSGPLPLPNDVAANGNQMSELLSIGCDSTGRLCRAVGFYRNINNNLKPLGYTSANGGVTWVLSSSLLLPANVAANGVQNTRLRGVACNSIGSLCTAVGFYQDINNNMAPLSYTTVNGGVIWTLSSPFPLPADVAGNGVQNSELQGVICDSTGIRCSAVGFYLTSSNNTAPLSYTTVNSGVTWSPGGPHLLPADVARGNQNSVLASL